MNEDQLKKEIDELLPQMDKWIAECERELFWLRVGFVSIVSFVFFLFVLALIYGSGHG